MLLNISQSDRIFDLYFMHGNKEKNRTFCWHYVDSTFPLVLLFLSLRRDMFVLWDLSHFLSHSCADFYFFPASRKQSLCIRYTYNIMRNTHTRWRERDTLQSDFTKFLPFEYIFYDRVENGNGRMIKSMQ